MNRPTPTEYAPYHTLPAFDQGISDYMEGRMRHLDGVAGQAWDRGAEYAMRVIRWSDRRDWANDPNVGKD